MSRGRAVVVALMFCGAVAAAEPECYEYSITYSSGWSGSDVGTGSSPAAACADLVSKMDGSVSGSTPSYTYHVVHSGTTEWDPGTLTFGCSITTTRTNNTTGEGPFPYGSGTGSFGGGSRTAVDCPEDPCEEQMGQSAFIGSNAPLGDSCVGGCVVNVTAGLSTVRCTAGGACTDTWMAQSTYSGSSCEAEPDAQKGNCISGAFGRMCIKEDPAGEDNCGIFNGDRVCVDSLESGCQSFASGGMACVVEGPGATEDVPDDGAGSPADPQMQVEKDGKVVNYYNSSTVSSSTSTVIANEATGSNGGDGDGDGDGEGEGSCTGGACDGELPGEFEDLDGFDTLTQSFLDRVAAAPVVATVSGLGDSLPAGACPNWEFTLWGESLSLSAPICSLWDSIAALLSAVMLVAWGLLASRIVLSA